ncbi:hypothetical protein LMG26696_03261 [Achromobacter pulmonis]|nr:hypothetical protein LMG26696_03261 [Achromobacter pulmonis]
MVQPAAPVGVSRGAKPSPIAPKPEPAWPGAGAGQKKAPWETKGPSVRDRLYLAGTVTGARAWPAGSFRNWKKLELGSTTSTSPGFENEAR